MLNVSLHSRLPSSARSRVLLGALALSAGIACSSSDEEGSGLGNGNGTGSANGSGSSSSTGSGASSSGPILNGDPAAGGSSTGGPTGPAGIETECDGIDNDGNGVIDDVDVAHDGVCDCLKIATLGKPGRWGTGDVFVTWLDARSQKGAADLVDSVLTPSLLAPFQVVVVQDVSTRAPFTAAEVEAVKAWVTAGGGLMTLTGYGGRGEVVNVNLLLAAFGMSYGEQGILAKARGGSTLPVSDWESHPISMDITLLGVDNGYPVLGAGTAFAHGGGFDIGRALEVGRGHVFAWMDEWVTYNSEWSQHPDYQVEQFWKNSLKWLTARTECQVVVGPGPS